LEKCQHNEERAQKLKNALEKQDFALLAYYSGVTTIHVSERDSQITVKPKGVGEFVNTWSPSGFVQY
jgi:homospermidine synthase